MEVVANQNIFATPLKVDDVADCYFYHTVELPGYGVIEGRVWDLRGGVDEYLGKVAFEGQRGLEIGPASGFLTFAIEKRGPDAVSGEVTGEHGCDFAPYPAVEGAPICRLAPTPQNFLWHTWWHFSTQFFTQFLAVMGFNTSEILRHQQRHRGRPYTLFTVVARR